MDIRVSGHQVDTGTALQSHAEERLGTIVDKYFSRALSSQVTLGKAPHGGFRCDIVTHVAQGLILKGSAIAQDAHIALDQSADKIEKQLRRYKRRLKDRHEGADHARRADEANLAQDAAYTVFVHDEAGEDEPADAPLVIAETRVDVPTASVSDAVMMLDLRNTNALMFKNAGTGVHNMVYRRGDGSIGWVEPR
ncbi:SSU ribosomal protein S30P [Novosphingobium aromaticivorans DSM 12444]|uniref:Ribosome hibernation promoting factor n=1 Tax=Novosphingobium aromaticivorans (strain ATCC 700278 / DSM 12444 / CCUG 56034 / CIP 105152 / NBRC 16084 / F199) TaxID=279238 RepID=Q2GC62_NOVAD|nr:ribosome-associated translation inhibitor RaiA [Novosphingobium aromaticivorans]ABD24561.1 SSU ribosomal protein S30P [Novosphingobium aromaticivorans DSM 12444]SCY24508.1 sigma 54 modulation protein /SSU ribosomal protein S30P [Novosphingobium aromaticivorans]